MRYAESSADWFHLACAVISVVRPDNVVLDYRLEYLEYYDVIDWLARHGDSVLPTPAAEGPYPLPEETTIDGCARAWSST
ncbi:hypothetical protein [Streptomyces sp. SID3343]|uniref:hypothetical protein n=1 Tax=Streptomyces sp. SID3343 TaxID=2690260 RepID=UPI00136973FB|nr:hypothetical protein [Streptomyces sp. SID3343]MYV98889.1 hypothetical protein [Streptomyces sp. SID3343]